MSTKATYRLRIQGRIKDINIILMNIDKEARALFGKDIVILMAQKTSWMEVHCDTEKVRNFIQHRVQNGEFAAVRQVVSSGKTWYNTLAA